MSEAKLLDNKWLLEIVGGAIAGVLGTLFVTNVLHIGSPPPSPSVSGDRRHLQLTVYPDVIQDDGSQASYQATVSVDGLTPNASAEISVDDPDGGTYSGVSTRIPDEGTVSITIQFPPDGGPPLEPGSYPVRVVDRASGASALATIQIVQP